MKGQDGPTQEISSDFHVLKREKPNMMKLVEKRRWMLQTGIVGIASGIFASVSADAQDTSSTIISNKSKVRSALNGWTTGNDDVLNLLSETVKWTIAGTSLVSGTTIGKTALITKVLAPFGARFSKSSEKFRPTRIIGIYSDGDTVIAHFDGRGIANDGKPYINTYAWFLKIKNGTIVEATAFFDSIAFNDLWTRVTPSYP